MKFLKIQPKHAKWQEMLSMKLLQILIMLKFLKIVFQTCERLLATDPIPRWARKLEFYLRNMTEANLEDHRARYFFPTFPCPDFGLSVDERDCGGAGAARFAEEGGSRQGREQGQRRRGGAGEGVV